MHSAKLKCRGPWGWQDGGNWPVSLSFYCWFPSTMNHWHFPQFAFHRSLRPAPPLGNMYFINKELFWPCILWPTHLWLTSRLCVSESLSSPLPLSVPSPVSLFRNRPILNSPLFPGLLWDPFYGRPGKRGWWGHLATGVVIGNKSEETFPGKGCMLGRAWWAGRPPLGPASLWRRWMNWVDTPTGKTLSFLHQVFAI